MEEEQDAPLQEQASGSVWDKVDRINKGVEKPSVWDQVDDLSARTNPQINFSIAAGAQIDGERAKRILNVQRRLTPTTPVPFIDRNLDYLEQKTAEDNFKADLFFNQDEKLKAWVVENAPKAALIRSNPDEMQKLGLMKLLLERPPALWPLSESAIDTQAKQNAKLLAEQNWEGPRDPNLFPRSEGAGADPFYASSKQEMENLYYQQQLDQLTAEEKVIRGGNPIGGAEAAINLNRTNPLWAAPVAGHIPGLLAKAGELMSKNAVKNKTATPLDLDILQRAARLDAVQQMRGKDFMGHLTEQAMTLPATMAEMMMGTSVGNAAVEATLGAEAKGLISKVSAWGLESAVAGSTLGIPSAAETYIQRATPQGALGEDKEGRLIYQVSGEKDEPQYIAIPKAALSSFADYFGAKVFGPWFANASLAERALAKQSLIMAFPKEALKFVGMTEASNFIKGIGGVQKLEAPEILRALSDPEAAKKVGAQLLLGGSMGVMHAASQNARAGVFDTKLKEIKAKMQAEGLEALGEMVQDSKVMTETPEDGKDFVKRFSQDGPHEHVWRPIESWNKYWTSRGISPREAARAVNGETASYDEAQRTKGLFQMPMGDYVEKIAANEEHSKDFAKTSTLDPEVPPLDKATEQTKATENRQPLMPEEFLAAQGKPYSDLWFLGLKGEKAEKAQKQLDAAMGEGLEQVKAEEVAKRQRAQDKELNAIREQVRPQVEAMVNDRPEQKALKGLQDAAPELKLDRADLAEKFGKNVRDVLPNGVTSEKGIHPDDAAEAYGFNSGDELLAALAERVIKSPRDVVNEETDRLIMETRPELLRPPELSPADIEDLKADQHSRLLKTQWENILSEDYATAKGLIKGAQRQPKSIASYREQAIKEIGGKKVRDIVPAKYKADMESARKQAEEAILGGDVEAAANAKERELDSYEHYRAALERQREIRAAENWAKRIQTKSFEAELGKADPEYLKQFLGIASTVELAKVPDSVLESRKALADFIKEKEANGESMAESVSAPDWLQREASKVNYKDLTADQFRDVMDLVKQLYTMARSQNKLMAGAKAVEWKTAEGKLVDEIRQNKPLEVQPTRSAETLWDKVKGVARKVDASLIKVEQFLKEMTKGDITAEWMDRFWHPLADAQAAEYDYNEKITGKIAEAVEEMPPEIRKKLREVVQFEGARRMTRVDLLGLALNAGNESNLSKLIRGEAQRKGGLTEAQIRQALNMLSAPEIEYVNKIHKILESMWPDIAKLHQELTGLQPEKVQPKSMTLENGTIEGGYYPLIYDFNESTEGAKQMEAKVGDMLANGYTLATLGWGHRKGRLEGFAAPIDFDVQNLPSHIAGVVKDITHRRWLLDANKIMQSKEIRAALNDTYGEAMTNRLTELVKEVVNDRNQASLPSLSVWRKLITGFRTNTAIAATGFKLGVMLEHTAGVGAAIDHLGIEYFRQGVAQTLQNPKEAFRDAVAKSGEMRHFLETGNRDIRDKLRELEGNTSTLANIQRTAAYAIGYANMVRALPVWWGAYKKAMAELPATKGLQGAELEKYAVYSADQAMRLTVGTAGAKDLNAVQSGSRGGDLMKLFTMFYTPGSILYSRLHDIGHEAGQTKDIPRALVRAFFVVPFAATMQALVKGHFPDKEKDETWGGWWLKSNATYPFSAVPIVRDIANTVAYGQDSSFETPGVAAMRQIMSAADFAKRAYEGEGTGYEALKKVHDAANHWMGLPDQQLFSTGEYLMDLHHGEAQSNTIFELYKNLLHYHHHAPK